MEKFKDYPFYKNICRIKTYNTLNTDNTSNIFDVDLKYIEEKKFFNIHDDIEEDYKIYLINKADNLILTFGSIYIIYVYYYSLNRFDKCFTIISNSDINYIKNIGNNIYKDTIFDAVDIHFTNNIYKDGFRGNVYSFISDIKSVI